MRATMNSDHPTKPKRILIVTHGYFPMHNPRAFRWTAIAEKWVDEGKSVDVITAWTPGLSRCENAEGVHVYRVGGGILERIRKRLDSSGAALTRVEERDVRESQSQSIKKSRLKTLAKILHDLIWRNLYWPDYTCLWYFAAVSKARKLMSENNYQSLISVSIPFTGHLIGRRLKRENPDVHWMVDIGDPFCFAPYDRHNNRLLYDKLNYSAERKVFEQADSVSVTTSLTANEYAKLFPNAKHKIVVICPLVSVSDKTSNAAELLPDNSAKKLLVIGTLDSLMRSPDVFLNIVDHVARKVPGQTMEIHFIGSHRGIDSLFEHYETPSNLKVIRHGLCPRSEVITAMTDADILVNIGNQSVCQLPSKIVEYVWAGRPILNISRVTEDSSSIFLKDYPALLDLYIDGATPSEDQVEQLARFVTEPPPLVEKSVREQLLVPFNIETVVAAYNHTMNPSV